MTSPRVDLLGGLEGMERYMTSPRVGLLGGLEGMERCMTSRLKFPVGWSQVVREVWCITSYVMNLKSSSQKGERHQALWEVEYLQLNELGVVMGLAQVRMLCNYPRFECPAEKIVASELKASESLHI